MIICSCTVISDLDIEAAVAEIMSAGPGVIPTPGVVFRHLNKRMQCCSCAPLSVAAIYKAMDQLARDTRISPYVLAEARAKLIRFELRQEDRRRHKSEMEQSQRRAVA
ncbi:hypothetical protein DLM45_12135 [Hyphomicrobium methylovorum]|nr:hypothetical protein [Hyphomicrobium methylovorum]